MPIRVLIVHTNLILVSGLRTILEQAAMEVVGEAVAWEPLVALMHSQHPDVVLLDPLSSFKFRSRRFVAFPTKEVCMTRLFSIRLRSWWSHRVLPFLFTYVLFLGTLFVLYLALHRH